MSFNTDERIFRCYQSTATGEHTDSTADQSILGDPKLKLLAGVLVLAFGVLFYNFATYAEHHKKPGLDPASSAPVSAPSTPSPERPVPASSRPVAVADRGGGPDRVADRPAGDFFHRLGIRPLLVAYQSLADLDNRKLAFIADSDAGIRTVIFADLFAAGVRASIRGLCQITLIGSDGSSLALGCGSVAVDRCASKLDTPELVIRRDCHKPGEPPSLSPALPTPQNALVASASSLLDRKP